ncbi:hypothetical protein Pmani_005160 [Petrolisthes manimaculis]|uniref:Uncharacterized protein n=1 Tax=Petrolisthes manimaculis TaxID=1843537 RepID=A0AAE1QF55_9EUCA|nr:hypothetical protein Pmani_005160 [Petrolisthes manimaculis]
MGYSPTTPTQNYHHHKPSDHSTQWFWSVRPSDSGRLIWCWGISTERMDCGSFEFVDVTKLCNNFKMLEDERMKVKVEQCNDDEKLQEEGMGIKVEDCTDEDVIVKVEHDIDEDDKRKREEPSTSKGNIKCLKKKKLASRGKQEALKLTSERKYLLREMDLELHRKRLELIDYEKKLITSYYEGQRELQQLQKRLLIEKHAKEISTPQQ